MRERRRRRVDWDEELRKTERIRRKGLFTSALSFGVALILIIAASRMNDVGIEFGRKVIFAFCFVAAMFLFRIVLKRRARLRQAREDAMMEATAKAIAKKVAMEEEK
jgi:Flp pilus assembly protein TadB